MSGWYVLMHTYLCDFRLQLSWTVERGAGVHYDNEKIAKQHGTLAHRTGAESAGDYGINAVVERQIGGGGMVVDKARVENGVAARRPVGRRRPAVAGCGGVAGRR